ncbi:MAG: hypothetical protein HZC29_02355 [Thaumarchaeota archaeon]|nr:hypothetical protein [Nitrososphaerota archaeon]
MLFTPTQYQCTAVPELDYYASARGLDPMFVRAVMETEAGTDQNGNYDQCAVAKVCKAGAGTTRDGCFDDDNNRDDQCYAQGYDAIYDPTRFCPDRPPAPLLNGQPKWRWCAMGLMQTIEPPFTFWPANYREDGADGAWIAIFQASQKAQSADLTAARSCNKQFNPFNISDSICLATSKLATFMAQAKREIVTYRSNGWLNWGPEDTNKDNVFAAYIAASKYAGVWDARGLSTRASCTGMTVGDCWVLGYSGSWPFNSTYCSPATGKPQCATYGIPDSSRGYGYTDFVDYVNNYEFPLSNTGYSSDPGSKKLGYYFSLRNNCANSFCPDWKQLYTTYLGGSCNSAGICSGATWGETSTNPNQVNPRGSVIFPQSGNPYQPDPPAPQPAPAPGPGGVSP